MDEYLREQGISVLRLPPYHCQFNAIELTWAELKGYVDRTGTTADNLKIVHKLTYCTGYSHPLVEFILFFLENSMGRRKRVTSTKKNMRATRGVTSAEGPEIQNDIFCLFSIPSFENI